MNGGFFSRIKKASLTRLLGKPDPLVFNFLRQHLFLTSIFTACLRRHPRKGSAR